MARLTSMLITLAALFFALLAAAVAVFQVALVCGAPWGEWTLGGKHTGPLPRRIRLVAALSAVLLVGLSIVVVARAGIAFPAWAASSQVLAWFVVGYCVVGVLANYFTPSRRERMVWLPVVLLMLVTSTIVATS